MRALLLEDEPAAAANLRYLLRGIAPHIDVVAEHDTVAAAIAWLETQAAPDVIFSDIQLADGNVFAVFERVEARCPVVFVTAYDAYALRAFRHNGIDYLLKPLVPEELERAVAKLPRVPQSLPDLREVRDRLLRRPTSFRQSFLLPFRDQLIPVRAAEIAYFYTESEVVFARPDDGERRYVVGETLEALEEQLDPELFFRVNRQLIVRRGAVRGLQAHLNGRYLLRLEPAFEQEVSVSKAKAPVLRRWLGE